MRPCDLTSGRLTSRQNTRHPSWVRRLNSSLFCLLRCCERADKAGGAAQVRGRFPHLVALDAVLVEGAAGLEEGLVGAAAAGDEPNHGAALVAHRLLRPRWHAHAGGPLVEVMGDDGGVVARALGDLPAVARLSLEVADEGPLGHLVEREDVAHHEGSLLARVDELTRVHALRRAHQLVAALVPVRILELDPRHGCATPGLVDDLLHDALHVALPLSIVEGAKLHLSDAIAGVRLKDGALALTAAADDLTHLC
mmetsp:Transcript_35382/g.79814  ORF Transcript_35382/g.79814 Transcript_35382/m.79814 type:complete len:253 (+) Transcript_35382:461-1219(+)